MKNLKNEFDYSSINGEWFDNMKDTFNFRNQPTILEIITENMYADITKQMDNVCIEGLKRKGFEFKNIIELKSFMKSNCKYEDRVHVKQRIYFVNDIPFLIHYYEFVQKVDFSTTKRSVSLSTNCGSYAYL